MKKARHTISCAGLFVDLNCLLLEAILQADGPVKHQGWKDRVKMENKTVNMVGIGMFGVVNRLCFYYTKLYFRGNILQGKMVKVWCYI